ncbi:hypothetical protein QR46_1553 [Giardia duodenalis assemblage B]|uniref:Uncharacterized protein n=1 Tax=Giardia duodenalis assemblage B TaxID=1394984 RepID=A0A132NWI0_GIAIN|nr:hypothetical protein QR46_1553 [Giardia intestinalis assemblage B]
MAMLGGAALPPFVRIGKLVFLDTKTTYAKPDYDEAKLLTYAVTFRNGIGVKVPTDLNINYDKLEITLTEPDNGKNVATIPASQIIQAIPSQNVASQVTILVANVKGRESYKVWVPLEEIRRVNYILRDINKMVELYRDLLEENANPFMAAY